MHQIQVKRIVLCIETFLIDGGTDTVHSLILSEKFCHILFQLTRDYFTSDQKYLYIYGISEFSSFKFHVFMVKLAVYENHLHLT